MFVTKYIVKIINIFLIYIHKNENNYYSITIIFHISNFLLSYYENESLTEIVVKYN